MNTQVSVWYADINTLVMYPGMIYTDPIDDSYIDFYGDYNNFFFCASSRVFPCFFDDRHTHWG